MVKPKEDAMSKAIDGALEDEQIENMPLNSFRDYRKYNEAARARNKKARKLLHPIKPCPEDLHPKQRVTVHNIQAPENPQKVYLSNELIHFDKTLSPGVEYDLPECIIHHLSKLGNPVWKWRNKADGSKETFYDSKTPRFAIRTVYSGGE